MERLFTGAVAQGSYPVYIDDECGSLHSKLSVQILTAPTR